MIFKPTLSLSALSILLLSIAPVIHADQTVSYTYNGLGLIETVDGPRTDVNDTTTYTYDTSGNRTHITNALGHVTQITSHDLSGRPLTIIDANGASTQLSYDARGRLLSQNTEGRLTTFSYDLTGNVTQISQSNGQAISYYYDSANRSTGYSDALGNTVTYVLDDAGNQLQQNIADPLGTLTQTHSYIYDELSRLRSDIGADNQTANLNYDTNSNLSDQSDPNGNPTSNAFDGLDRLINTTDADSGQTGYSYDDRDNLTSVIDPNGHTTSYQYDAFDNLIQQNSPDTGLTTYTYDEAGNRLSQADANGVTRTYTYDALNRLTSIGFPDASLNETYTYDENDNNENGIGRLTSQTDSSGSGATTSSTSYRYDIRGNLVNVTTQRDAQTLSLDYQYNSSDQPIQITYPDGRSVGYSYDLAGQVSQVSTTDNQANTQTILSNMAYQPFGPMASQTFGNGLGTQQINDLDYHQTSLITPDVLERDYSFDANSNITGIIDLIASDNDQQFGYDTLNRLDDASSTHYGDIDYQYDATHNRTDLITLINSLIETETYQYAPDNNQLITKTGSTVINYQYDANGNITDNGLYQFTYGQDNRLHGVTQGGQAVASYSYNAQGQRSLKTAAGVTTYYLYGPGGQLLTETDASGSTQKNYIYANGQLVAIAQAGGTAVEIILDNVDASFSGSWPLSTSVQGYIGNNYQYHAKSSGSTSGTLGTPIDNTQATYSDNWPISTSANQYYDSNYQYHAGSLSNGPGVLGTPIDNLQASYVGSWPLSTSVNQYSESNYQYHAAGSGGNTATWASNVATTASYDVYATWTAYSNRASNAKYTIHHSTGSDTVSVNQQQNGGNWNLLGTYTLDATSSISLSDDANGYVVADGITLLPAGTPPNPTIQVETATWQLNASNTASYDVYAHWTAHSNRATNAKYTIHHSTGSDTVTVNQQQNGGQWNLLGTYTLDATSTVELSSDANGYVIADAVTTLPAGTPPIATTQTETATWTPEQTGEYQVYANWTEHSNRATDAKYTINHAGGSDIVTINQQQNGSNWNLLGTYTFNNSSTIVLSDDANGYVIADGLKLIPTATSGVSGLFYVHNDHLGTPQTITDQNQQIVWQALYDPFGKATILTQTLENNVRFPGQYFDGETGLHYNYFRDYDPSTGRYIVSDPIGVLGLLRRGGLYEINDKSYNYSVNPPFGSDLNLYEYTSGNPINRIDPRGDSVAKIIVPVVSVCGGLYVYFKGIKACGKKFPNHGNLGHPDYHAHIQCVSNVAGIIGLGMGDLLHLKRTFV